MDIQWIIFAIILIANAIVAFAIASMLLQRPQKPGLRSMTLLLAGLGIWSFAYAMITLSSTLEWKIFWLKVENIGILSVPIFWFFFALKYTHMDQWLTRKPAQLLFWVIPVVSLAFLLSENRFHLYYTDVQMVATNGGPLIISRGPMYWIAFFQAYALILAGMAVLVWRFIRSHMVYHKQLPYLLGAVLIPFAVNVVYQINPGIFPIFEVPIDLTPLAFNVTAILVAASIFGLRLFDLIPIARDSVMEHIPEMVFVLDAYDRVMDANVMAQKWLGKSMDEILGQDPLDVFKPWPQLLNRFFLTEHTREEIEIPGNPPHTLEVIVTPIYNRFNALEGRVIVAHDITERKLLENKLRAVNQFLQEQLTENEILRLKLQEQAIRDPLTGVFNRRFFSEALDKQTARALREGSAFSILILDVDNFKKFNDTYGHKCGDIVLQALANMLVENTRRGDIVCRYGGEEFVILMTDVAAASARERAEFLRKRFNDMAIEHNGNKLQCTFSAGIASFPIHADSGEALLNLADQAMYKSKADGRNRVSVYSPEVQYHVPVD